MINAKDVRQTMPSQIDFNLNLQEELNNIENKIKEAALKDENYILIDYEENVYFYQKIKYTLQDANYSTEVIKRKPGEFYKNWCDIMHCDEPYFLLKISW